MSHLMQVSFLIHTSWLCQYNTLFSAQLESFQPAYIVMEDFLAVIDKSIVIVPPSTQSHVKEAVVKSCSIAPNTLCFPIFI